MAFDEGLAQRVREIASETEGYGEKKMFGGVAFLQNGHMACGIVNDRLMVRVGPEAHDEAMARPHTAPMDFNGKAMRGMVYVLPAGLMSQAALASWVRQGFAYAAAQPPKKAKPRPLKRP